MTSTPEGDRFPEPEIVAPEPPPDAWDVLQPPEGHVPVPSGPRDARGTRLGAAGLVGVLLGMVVVVVSWLIGSTRGLGLAAVIVVASLAVAFVGYRRFRRA